MGKITMTPKPHNPRGAGRKPSLIPTRRVAFRLSEPHIQSLKSRGDGDATAGLRALINATNSETGTPVIGAYIYLHACNSSLA